MEKYQAFWRRFIALIIDGLIFKPFEWLNNGIMAISPSDLIFFLWLVIWSSAGLIYTIGMHGAYGQTLGKMITGVKVLDISEDKLSYRQAALRDIVPLLGWPVSIYASFQASFGGMGFVNAFSTPAMLIYFSILFGWIILEMVTMLFNKKRRAIHDFIAGSVVVKTT
ncbi:MAG: RDD family protein [Gammaproteobacteria bacterium]|nr:RDD family protein [Gammaproteobacteria bacterium]